MAEDCDPLCILEKVKKITQEKCLFVKFNKDEKHEKMLYNFCQKMGFIIDFKSLIFAFHLATFKFVNSKNRANFQEALELLKDDFKKKHLKISEMDKIDEYLYAGNGEMETNDKIWNIISSDGKDEKLIVEQQKKILEDIKRKKKEKDEMEAKDRSFAIDLLCK